MSYNYKLSLVLTVFAFGTSLGILITLFPHMAFAAPGDLIWQQTGASIPPNSTDGNNSNSEFTAVDAEDNAVYTATTNSLFFGTTINSVGLQVWSPDGALVTSRYIRGPVYNAVYQIQYNSSTNQLEVFRDDGTIEIRDPSTLAFISSSASSPLCGVNLGNVGPCLVSDSQNWRSAYRFWGTDAQEIDHATHTGPLYTGGLWPGILESGNAEVYPPTWAWNVTLSNPAWDAFMLPAPTIENDPHDGIEAVSMPPSTEQAQLSTPGYIYIVGADYSVTATGVGSEVGWIEKRELPAICTGWGLCWNLALLNASPSSPVTSGSSITLNWSATQNVIGFKPSQGFQQTPFSSCTLTSSNPSEWAGGTFLGSGQQSVIVTTTTTFSGTCTNYAGEIVPLSPVTIVVTTPPAPDLTAGATAASSSVNPNQPTPFSATVYNQGSATASNFPNAIQIANSNESATLSYVNTGTVTSLAAGASTPISGSYTFSSPGTYNVRACSNTDTSGNTVIAESNTSNNCGPWTTITVTGVSVSCSVSPSSGNTTTSFTWTATASGGSGSYTYSWSGNGVPNGYTNQKVLNTYKTPGTSTFTVPSGVTELLVQAWGGGGAGGDGGDYAEPPVGGGGGGGGGFAESLVSVTPGQNITVVVGGGGAMGSYVGDNGGNGGYSSFVAPSVTTTGLGGDGGQGAAAAAAYTDTAGGTGGGALANQIRTLGQNGSSGLDTLFTPGGNGGNGGGNGGGQGGAGANNGNNGIAGVGIQPGGGGGGGGGICGPASTNPYGTPYSCIGASGAPGEVIVSSVVPNSIIATYNASGTYNVTVTVTDSSGSQTSASCVNSGGGNGITVYPAYPPPTVLLSNNGPVISGQKASLTWSSTNTNYPGSYCVGTGFGGNGQKLSTSGTTSTLPLTTDTSYSITCSNPGGSAIANTSVVVIQPSVSIIANPDRVSSASGGGTSTISWNASDVNSCTVTRSDSVTPFASGLATNGSLTGSKNASSITQQTIFKITCRTSGSPVSAQTIVNILPVFQQF